MKRAQHIRRGKSAFEVIEEAVHLVRDGSGRALAAYYIGSLPFVLALLFFCADMSRSPFASQHLAEAALGLGGLFLWMKAWQAVFARQLIERLTGNTTVLTWKSCVRIFVAQATLQPSALFLLPLASIPILPFAWVYAFYQNATVFGADDQGNTRAIITRSARQATLWPRQNHAVLSVFFAFGVFVLLNWATAVLLLPLMLKKLLGLESMFSLSPLSMLNTTFLAVVAGLTYLCVDPLVKAVYALRCFYGEALTSGADLQAELKRFSPTPVLAAFLVLLGSPSGWCQEPADAGRPSAESQSPAASAPAGKIAPMELDRAISEVLQQRKYAWRAPREKSAPAAEKGVIGRFLERSAETLKRWARSAAEWIGRMIRKLWPQPQPSAPYASGFGWLTRLHLLIYLLVAAAAVGIFLLVRHTLRTRSARLTSVSAVPIQPVVDVADENVGPEQLPEDGWTTLANELLARGELRLAIRAYYLASLAQLAARNLITVARFKSNRDYERELLRRAHSWPDLLARFSDNVSTFDRIWYGTHGVDEDLAKAFAANVLAMRTAA